MVPTASESELKVSRDPPAASRRSNLVSLAKQISGKIEISSVHLKICFDNYDEVKIQTVSVYKYRL